MGQLIRYFPSPEFFKGIRLASLFTARNGPEFLANEIHPDISRANTAQPDFLNTSTIDSLVAMFKYNAHILIARFWASVNCYFEVPQSII
jgi:hypothetical protein